MGVGQIKGIDCLQFNDAALGLQRKLGVNDDWAEHFHCTLVSASPAGRPGSLLRRASRRVECPFTYALSRTASKQRLKV